MFLLISSKKLDLDSKVTTDMKGFGFTPIYIKDLEPEKSDELNEIVFDIEPGLDFSDIIDRYDRDESFSDKIIANIKKSGDGYLSFVSENSVSGYNVVREFIDSSGIILRYFWKQGTSFKGETKKNQDKEVGGVCILQIINTSDSKIVFYKLNEFATGFRIEDLFGNELGDFSGPELEQKEQFEVAVGEKMEFTHNFNLTAPSGFYKFVPYTSNFEFEGKEGVSFWTFPPITIKIE
ncbi:MAG: hypothetical protein ACTSYZ_05860 [Candidatus Helarchaeota archaeon]